MASTNVPPRPAAPIHPVPPSVWRMREREAVSGLLARANALTIVLSGQCSTPDGQRREFRHYVNVLEQILDMAAEAENRAGVLSAAARKQVSRARSLCEIMLGDEVGNGLLQGNHLNDDLTSWALVALGEQLEVAKCAVDDDETTAHCQEAA